MAFGEAAERVMEPQRQEVAVVSPPGPGPGAGLSWWSGLQCGVHVQQEQEVGGA